ncbi:helix-turn-helix transcriptional regulator [Thorsellia anophelis]|uniref:WYL domain-containing protein n=1 Tax=Thorsellia anophelis DSM 18579 TaxID=1123402 RepID=A0A1I0CVB1_9GAMM|nr:YafY family protein [Thorsellia anophelis]SET23558.1 WYL domain-containing protein [Thorsellia anophelis DSM 18579]
MSRAERLLELLQLLREHRYAVTAEHLASELNISTRTLYRDINSLRAQGACIDGSPGTGYLLTERFTLPPLTFDDDELLALSLGLKWVVKSTDPELVRSAKRAHAKINAVISSSSKIKLNHHGITVLKKPVTDPNLLIVRKSIQLGVKLEIVYKDLKDKISTRIIWPCALGFFDDSAVIAAWCELRQNFRHFRIDRIESIIELESYPIAPLQLLKRWQDETAINLG